ncbi:DUF3311 domain-containing protein [Neobacillus mesonae]|uniref:DUF3311 domain-containing protein n=1 Tax=Neobacillus mesonae TaxID=1193713 RepID=UPI002E1D40B8|nr:DUF3311 domain-containing protein [Neobacillus mesonae]
MLSRQFGSVLVGLVIPFAAVLGVIPFISKMGTTVLGFPILYFWVFLWFPLTTVCLCISWHFFDRHAYEDGFDEGGDH